MLPSLKIPTRRWSDLLTPLTRHPVVGWKSQSSTSTGAASTGLWVMSFMAPSLSLTGKCDTPVRSIAVHSSKK